ncbi:hypothetical protein L1987_43254 [Smallanthus sonchifolius]|uniref:Uncharacterized protein n=1 Tax=Smallanthus sonchifolius TaxID=185202 RepID=A0ACB9GMB1_9ASTR|nr:hypothetical protein L1987_43254 [Smallanthus sonchifolius]
MDDGAQPSRINPPTQNLTPNRLSDETQRSKHEQKRIGNDLAGLRLGTNQHSRQKMKHAKNSRGKGKNANPGNDFHFVASKDVTAVGGKKKVGSEAKWPEVAKRLGFEETYGPNLNIIYEGYLELMSWKYSVMKDKEKELGETSGTHMQEPEAKSKDGGKATKEDAVQTDDQKAAPTREYIGAVVDNTEGDAFALKILV